MYFNVTNQVTLKAVYYEFRIQHCSTRAKLFTKHSEEQFNSQDLAELTCLNPVQLKRVTTTLNNQQYIDSIRGKVVAIELMRTLQPSP